MEDDIMISVKNASKTFMLDDPSCTKKIFKKKMEFNVFHDLNLEVRRGEVVGVIGRNGAGKSTFLKLVSEILDPDTGSVTIKGNVASILELSMGFHPDMTGRENIRIRSELYGMDHKTVDDNVEKVVKYSDLGAFIDNPVRTYSSGMRSRLAFAVMVSVDAEVYIIDEALSTGDAAFSAKASEHLKNLVREGKTILITSHNTGVIESTCSRAIWLHEKTIYMDGPAEEVCAAYKKAITESFEVTKSLAEDGATGAMYRLATFYRDGNDCEPDLELYHHWLKKAAEKDHPMAMSEYGDVLMSQGDSENAAKMYYNSAGLGNRDAKMKHAVLVSMERSGILELRTSLEKLAESGYFYDECNLGNCLLKTAISESDYSKAYSAFETARSHGSIEAAYQMGVMLRDGRGTARDIPKCIELFEEAANRGHARAASSLGDLFEKGVFVEKDAEKAFKYYLLAAEEGSFFVMYDVARKYEDGEGVEKNQEEADKWYRRYATSSVAMMINDASDSLAGRTKDYDAAQKLLSYSIEGMNPRAVAKRRIVKGSTPEEIFVEVSETGKIMGKPRSALARLYLDGTGVEKDETKAFSLFKDAADGLDEDSMYQVAMMYRDGVGTPANEVAYSYYMRMAADCRNRDAQILVAKWERRNAKRRSKAAESSESDQQEDNNDVSPVKPELSEEIVPESTSSVEKSEILTEKDRKSQVNASEKEKKSGNPQTKGKKPQVNAPNQKKKSSNPKNKGKKPQVKPEKKKQ